MKQNEIRDRTIAAVALIDNLTEQLDEAKAELRKIQSLCRHPSLAMDSYSSQCRVCLKKTYFSDR